jgi:hypothetical protein
VPYWLAGCLWCSDIPAMQSMRVYAYKLAHHKRCDLRFFQKFSGLNSLHYQCEGTILAKIFERLMVVFSGCGLVGKDAL